MSRLVPCYECGDSFAQHQPEDRICYLCQEEERLYPRLKGWRLMLVWAGCALFIGLFYGFAAWVVLDPNGAYRTLAGVANRVREVLP